MSIKKQFLKSKPVCKVTFKVPKKDATDANEVYLVGEFNQWNETALPMQGLKSGDFKTTIELEKGREYQFRYLVDGETWVNDSDADKYVSTPFSSENSVLVI